ncbi:MAG: cytochrome P450 [Solirubrobacterales bacterium]
MERTVPTMPGFDPLSQEFLIDPYPVLERARRENPVFFYEPLNLWVVTRYDDIVAAVGDFETFSSRAIGVVPPPADIADQVPSDLMDEAFIGLDPPVHTVSRKNANKAFTRGLVDEQEGPMRRIADELIDGFLDRGECDLINEYCYPYTLRVIVGMLGLPEADIDRFRAWSESMFALMSPADADAEDKGPPKPMSEDEARRHWLSIAEGRAYYAAVVEARRAEPGDDLITAMVRATDDEGNPALPTNRIVTHVTELIAAGNDTTANLMGQMTMLFDAAPDQRAAVLEDMSLMANAVDEALRRRGTAPGAFRITTRPVELGGVEIPARSMVWLVYISAGHDEEHFPDPRRFDVRRENADKHLSLGRGRHKCMGAPLARLGGRIGMERLLTRIPDIRVVPGRQLTYSPAMTVLPLHSLRVEWDPPR